MHSGGISLVCTFSMPPVPSRLGAPAADMEETAVAEIAVASEAQAMDVQNLQVDLASEPQNLVTLHSPDGLNPPYKVLFFVINMKNSTADCH